MLSTILGFNKHLCGIGGSTDDYFVERMPRVLWSIQYIYKNNLSEIYLPALYVLINLEQVLTEYIFCTDQQYNDGAKELLIETQALIVRIEETDEGKKILEANMQLFLFLNTQRIRTNKALGVDEKTEIPTISEIPNLKTEHKLRILTSLFYLNKEHIH
jgi:hypothetical protein